MKQYERGGLEEDERPGEKGRKGRGGEREENRKRKCVANRYWIVG